MAIEDGATAGHWTGLFFWVPGLLLLAAVLGYALGDRPKRLGWALGVPPVIWYFAFGSRGDGDGLWILTPFYLAAWVLGAVLLAKGAMVLRSLQSP